MPDTTFDLLSLEAKTKFSEISNIVFKTHENFNEKLLIELEEKARAVVDYDQILLKLLHERGGMGMLLATTNEAKPAICCRSCNTVTTQIRWICPICNAPYIGLPLPSLMPRPLTDMEFVLIKKGSCLMGDFFGDGEANERPVHDIEVGDYYIGKYPVTQSEWQQVMGNNPSSFKDDSNPVVSVNWHDTQEFITRLSELLGKCFRLPTEAEWEYAARCGSKTERWSGTNDESKLDDYAWYDDNSDDRTHPIGEKKPNEIGLHDMSGNVWEWCSDWYDEHYYKISPTMNPQGPDSGEYRVLRGGSWDFMSNNARVSFRGRCGPARRDNNNGFRLVLSVDEE